MGICASNNKNDKTSDNNKTEVIQDYRNNKIFSINDLGDVIPDNPIQTKINFSVKLSGFRLRNVDPKCFYLIKVVHPFGNSNYFFTKLSSGPFAKYEESENFEFSEDFDKIKKMNLEIQIWEISKIADPTLYSDFLKYTSKTKPNSKCVLDLITLIIGPSHHDIQLYNTAMTKEFGRIIFDSAFIHVSNMKIEIKNLILPIYNLSKKDICLKLEIIHDHHSDSSDYTFPIKSSKVDLEKKQITYSWISAPNDLIEININKINLNDLKNGSLKLYIYDTKIENMKNQIKSDSQKFTKVPIIINEETFYTKISDLLGVCSISIPKVLQENNDTITKQSSMFFRVGNSLYKDTFSNTKQNEFIKSKSDVHNNNNNNENNEKVFVKLSVFNNVEKMINENVIVKGNVIGKIEAKIKVSSIPLIKQIVCGVHTEKGFDISSHYLTISNSQSKSKITINDMSEEIRVIDQESTKLFQKLSESSSLNILSNKAIEIKKQISEHLQIILKNLKKSIKEKSLFYKYNRLEELSMSQELMANLGSHIIEILENLDEEHKNISIDILETIIYRAEYDLGTFANNINNKLVDVSLRKNAISSFLQFFNKIIEFAINSFNKKVKDLKIRNLVEIIFSYAYVKNPNFRNQLIKSIQSKNKFTFIGKDKEYSLIKINKLSYPFYEHFIESKAEIYSISEDEYKKYHSNIDEDVINPVLSTIDWENLFYLKLKNDLDKETEQLYKETKEQMNKIDEIVNNKDWQIRFSSKGNVFFMFIKRLVEYIKSHIVISIDIDWSFIPGFDIIYFVLLNEIKEKESCNLSPIFLEVLNLFSSDFKLMNIFLTAIACKTNVYQVSSVNIFFTFLDMLFKGSAKEKTKLYQHLDYHIISNCINILIKQDHSINISKALWFLYGNSDLMDPEYSYEIIKSQILDLFFNDLFFHWSWQVRQIFFHYLIYILFFKFSKIFNTNNKSNQNQGQGKNLRIFDSMNNIIELSKIKIEECSKIANYAKENRFDGSAKKRFSFDDYYMKNTFNDENKIPDKYSKFAIQSFNHYLEVYDQFNNWKNDNIKKNKINLEYPIMYVEDIKDDVIEYKENW